MRKVPFGIVLGNLPDKELREGSLVRSKDLLTP